MRVTFEIKWIIENLKKIKMAAIFATKSEIREYSNAQKFPDPQYVVSN